MTRCPALLALLSLGLAGPTTAQDVPRLAIACQVRDAPSYRGAVVGELPAGAAPETRGRADRWVRIAFGGRYAYVGFACFATAAEAAMLARPPAPPARTATPSAPAASPRPPAARPSAPAANPSPPVTRAAPPPAIPSPPPPSPSPPAGSEPGVRPSCPIGRPLTRGPRGGCYYVTDSGRRSYVDRGCCA